MSFFVIDGQLKVESVPVGNFSQERLRRARRIYSLNRRRLIRRMPGAGNNLSLKPYSGSGHSCSRLGRSRIPGRGMVVGGVCSARGGRPGHQDPICKVRLSMPWREKVLCRLESWYAWATHGHVFVVDTSQRPLKRTNEVLRCIDTIFSLTQVPRHGNVLFASDAESYRALRTLGSCIDLEAPDLYLLTSYAPGRSLFVFTNKPKELVASLNR